MSTKVSVIIPTHKRSEFLQRAIDSVLNQTYLNIEIIIVDDNNPDSHYRKETEEKMAKYINNSKVIYLKNSRNLGGSLARNIGIFNSKGDYITFLDDDDIYLPEKVSVQVKYMVENELDMSFTDVRSHNVGDKLVDYREYPYIRSFNNEELLKYHIIYHLTPTSTYMFKREAVIKIGGFDVISMGQEFMLMLKAIESGMKIGYIPGAHVIEYLHSGERISNGENKIKGETQLFNFKRKYFNVLSIRQRQYVKFRHHVVMMIAGKRSKKWGIAIMHLIEALFASPLDCILETINQVQKINKYKAINLEG